MAVPFTQAQLLLAEIASSLAVEASDADKTDLAASLSALSLEISGAIISESEFFGGADAVISGDPPVTIYVQKGSAAQVWAQVLEAAASTVRSKINNTVENHMNTIQQSQVTIATETVTMDNHLDRIQSVVEDIETRESDTFVPGPHVRGIDATWDYSGSYGSAAIARAMMVLNLKATNTLDDVRSEVVNPTPIP